jgi:hypothetical protein
VQGEEEEEEEEEEGSYLIVERGQGLSWKVAVNGA